MQTLVVGDLHGQFESVPKVLKFGLPVVFLGDYMDSYTRSDEDCYMTIDLVNQAILEGKAVGLLANHEMSYLEPEMRCSGWTSVKQHKISMDYKETLLANFKPYHWAEGFLMSHAGISNYLLKYMTDRYATPYTLEKYLEEGDYNQIGYSRGGSKPCGGLYWCDWREFEPVEGVKQVVGHTRGRGIREKDGNYCIDCLEDGYNQILMIEDGKAEIVTL